MSEEAVRTQETKTERRWNDDVETAADWFWFSAKTNTMHPPTLSPRRPNWLQRVYMGIVYGVVAVYL